MSCVVCRRQPGVTTRWRCRRSTSTSPGAPCLESSCTRPRRGWRRALGRRPPDDFAASTASPSTRACWTFSSQAASRRCRPRPTRPPRRRWSQVRCLGGPTAPAATASTRGRRRPSTAAIVRPATFLSAAARSRTWPWRTAAADRPCRTRSCSGRRATVVPPPRRHVPLHWITESPWTPAPGSRNVDGLTPGPRRQNSAIIVVRAASRERRDVTSRVVWRRWRLSTRNKPRMPQRVWTRQLSPGPRSSDCRQVVREDALSYSACGHLQGAMFWQFRSVLELPCVVALAVKRDFSWGRVAANHVAPLNDGLTFSVTLLKISRDLKSTATDCILLLYGVSSYTICKS